MRNYLTKLSLVLGFICAILLGFGGVASAHVLQENNGISAVLHIPPDDNPVAARPTSLDFAFNNEQGTFTLADCHCQIKVQRDGKVIQNVPLEHPLGGGLLDATATVNFPTIGVYDVLVTGSSKQAKFKSFTLDYVERVATSANTADADKTNSSITALLISFASLVLLAMIASAAISRGGRYRPSPAKKSKT